MIRSQNMTDYKWVKKQSLGFRSGGIAWEFYRYERRHTSTTLRRVILIKNRLENDNMKIKCGKLIEL